MAPLDLLVAPEAWLIGRVHIREAERGGIATPPWQCTVTPHGSSEAHALLVEILDRLRTAGLAEVEIDDSAGYLETRSIARLEHDCSTADEELALRVARTAVLVRRVLGRAHEHPPVRISDTVPEWLDPDAGGTEAEWDEAFAQCERSTERLRRSIMNTQTPGRPIEDVLSSALRAIGIEPPPRDATQPDPDGIDSEGEVELGDSSHIEVEGSVLAFQLRNEALDLVVALEVLQSTSEAREQLGGATAGLLEALGASPRPRAASWSAGNWHS